MGCSEKKRGVEKKKESTVCGRTRREEERRGVLIRRHKKRIRAELSAVFNARRDDLLTRSTLNFDCSFPRDSWTTRFQRSDPAQHNSSGVHTHTLARGLTRSNPLLRSVCVCVCVQSSSTRGFCSRRQTRVNTQIQSMHTDSVEIGRNIGKGRNNGFQNMN